MSCGGVWCGVGPMTLAGYVVENMIYETYWALQSVGVWFVVLWWCWCGVGPVTGHAVEKRQVPDPLSSAGILGKASVGGFFYVGPLTLVMLLKKNPERSDFADCWVGFYVWWWCWCGACAIFPGFVRMFLIIYLVVWFLGILQFCVLLCVQGASQWRLGILPLELKTPVPR